MCCHNINWFTSVFLTLKYKDEFVIQMSQRVLDPHLGECVRMCFFDLFSLILSSSYVLFKTMFPCNFFNKFCPLNSEF